MTIKKLQSKQVSQQDCQTEISGNIGSKSMLEKLQSELANRDKEILTLKAKLQQKQEFSKEVESLKAKLSPLQTLQDKVDTIESTTNLSVDSVIKLQREVEALGELNKEKIDRVVQLTNEKELIINSQNILKSELAKYQAVINKIELEGSRTIQRIEADERQNQVQNDLSTSSEKERIAPQKYKGTSNPLRINGFLSF